jgi:putative tryptophan/tyrosine transport system substrate-binding protein
MSTGRRSRLNGDGGQDRVEGLAADLVGRNVDVIVTGGTPAAKALKTATGTIPIVMAIIGDPVAAGLVASLARPGGNATGFSIVAPDLSGKRLELLKEIVPEVSPVAVMLNTRNPQSQFELNEMQAAARAMGLQLHPVQVSPEDTFSRTRFFSASERRSWTLPPGAGCRRCIFSRSLQKGEAS